jgi:acyl-CoA synthetase (AMP-forming)/AMP-acid ligase II/acyl carrier protein
MSAPFSASQLYVGLAARDKAEFLVRPGGVLRYDQLLDGIRGCCALFHERGTVEGERVLIVTTDEQAAITTFAAALLDGLVPVMLTPDTAEPRAAALAASVSPRLIVADVSRCTEAWAKSAIFVKQPVKTLFGRTRPAGSGFHAAIGQGRDEPRLPNSPDALAYILFTSGTTSAPKGAMITHRNIFSHLRTLSRLYPCDRDSRIFNGMVLAHADGLVQGLLLALANGCALIRSGPFSVQNMESWLNSVRALRATHFISVPTVYALIDRYAAHSDYFDDAEFRSLTSVAAKLDESLWRRLESRFGRPVFSHYGLTETTTSGLYAGPHPEMGPTGTLGKPIDMQARIVDANDLEVKDGETGELWLSGDNVFAGYWRDEKKTAAVLRRDGWFRTGDLVRKRADGAHEIRGRIKTAITSGGFLIMPDEVDEALLAHPSVAEAATIGVPDADFGEIVVSAVVLDGYADETGLIDHCRTRLEAMKVPKRIVVLSAIPRGDAGKPRVDTLRAIVEAASPANPGRNDVAQGVLRVASLTFHVPIESLSTNSAAGEVPGWDSFAHINLVLRAEQHFGVRISTAEVAAIGTLADLASAIERAR